MKSRRKNTTTSLSDSRQPHNPCDQGFTLVELMVTVAILGVLVTAAVGIFDISTQKQRIVACDTNKETIELAIARAAAIYEKPVGQIFDADVDPFITGGIASLQCEANKNPQASYHVINGVISPQHNHR